MPPINLASLMATKPCSDFPPERVEALLAQYGPFTSWRHLAEKARAENWPVSLSDIRLTAYRAATPQQLNMALNPIAALPLTAVRDAEAWAARAARDVWAVRTAATYAANAAAHAAAYAAADPNTADAAFDSAYEKATWESLKHICSVLDGEE